MNKEIDARGMNCPLPVIHTKKALESIDQGKITTIVDNETARENISKLAKSLDCEIDIQENQGSYYIDIFKDYETQGMEAMDIQCDDSPKKDLVILIGQDQMGEGSVELGKVLMKGYLYTLTEVTPYPKAIILVNSGVRLSTEDPETIGHLRILEANGVEILSCGTCLDYFKLKDKLVVGGLTNMYTIVEHLNNANNTIKL
nr:sulfurtransferase-like selenium metabolism protein YedF [Alkaliphilus metalliredigens]